MALEDLGRNLRTTRKAHGLSQEAVARRAGVSLNLYGKLERSELTNPHYTTVASLARALDVSVDELVEGSVGKAGAPESGPSRSGDTEGSGEERREDAYEPWLEFVNRYAARWEQKIDEGAFGRGEVIEFMASTEDFGLVLRRLGLREKREQPTEYEGTFGPIIGQAIGRLMNLFEMIASEGAKQFEENDLARLRRRREELADGQGKGSEDRDAV